MEERVEKGDAGRGPGFRGRVLMFVAFLGVYYVLYYAIFIRRVGEYFGDILKHFAFARRFLQ